MRCGICGKTALYRYAKTDTEGRCKEHKDLIPESYVRLMQHREADAARFGAARKASDARLLNVTGRRRRGVAMTPHRYV